MSEPLIARAIDGWIDPERVFAACHAGDADCFWLDAGPDAPEGWSWVGSGAPEPSGAVVRDRVLEGRAGDGDGGRLRGGWVGWLGYDAAAARAGAPAATPEEGVAQELWLRTTRYVAFDHSARRMWAYAGTAEMDAYVAQVRCSPPAADLVPAADVGVAHGRHSAEEYATLIERCRAAIREGDAYQLCLTTRFRIDGDVDPVAAYRRLRRATPAHHGGLIVSGDAGLVSASPERFLEVADRVVRTRPIKGTRPRGRDAADDAALARELRESEKEQAENVMIVDLMRNDLSRVCEPGTVGVDDLLAVETYPAVHQLVSTVSGRAREATTVGDLLDAAFPAGSMTGAPKLSAMSILHRLERGPRGIFAGCFGWVGDDGGVDLAMVIRSIVVHPGGAYIGAGGGITWRSEPAAEVDEVAVKARGPLAALGARLPDGWAARVG